MGTKEKKAIIVWIFAIIFLLSMNNAYAQVVASETMPTEETAEEKEQKTMTQETVSAEEKEQKTATQETMPAEEKEQKTATQETVPAEEKEQKTATQETVVAKEKEQETVSSEEEAAETTTQEEEVSETVTPETTVLKTTALKATASDFIFLSDIAYVQGKSFAGNGNNIILDKNRDEKLITLNVDGVSRAFLKGVCAWATSEVVYDLREYDFDYFTAYLGVDESEKNSYYNTGVKFEIYTSDDGENWGSPIYKIDYSDAFTAAQFVKADIKGKKYLKLVANSNSSNWWAEWYDEAVYADAKLIKEGYIEDNTTVDFIKTVEEYDRIIKTMSLDQEITGSYELTLLQREFVKNAGYNELQQLVRYKEEYKTAVLWLMSDVENLRLYVLGGEPDGAHINALRVLSDLYAVYRDDLKNEGVTAEGTVLKDLYRRMMITLSLTHSAKVGLWVSGASGNPDAPNDSNAIKRYAIYKKLHQEGLLDDRIFESLNIEEMRFVLNNIIDDEEIEWLNAYSREKNSRDPYTYISYDYEMDYNYRLEQYYSKDNYDKWNQKYNLSRYNITYQKGYPKLWIVFEEGAVCGGISKTGSNLQGVYGVPSSVVGQPGHAAYIVYSHNSKGEGVWNLYNDVSGWAYSGRTEKLGVRMPCGWGGGSYASGHPVSYVLLAQAALNDFENYEKAEKILLLANTYKNDGQKLEKIYRKALDVQAINFDAWYGLISLYKADTAKTEKDYMNLAEEIAANLKYYPLAMYDLLRLIEPHLTSMEYKVRFTILQKNSLTEAANATSADTIQETAVKAVAKRLLGSTDTEVATFSFDGKNAGEIVLSSRFEGVGVVWEYSLDGKQSWTQTQAHSLKLTDEELKKINEQNDILIHLVGTSYDKENIHAIDITKASAPTNLYSNDHENRVIGITDEMEWSFGTGGAWTRFSARTPDLTGNKSILVRKGNTGTVLAGDSITLSFTQNDTNKKYQYISIDRLSIADFSTEQNNSSNAAANAIDGNINTIWHTLWDGSDSSKYITIKLDVPAYISRVEYVPRKDGSNGRVKNAQILVSQDGQNWTQVVASTNWDAGNSVKSVDFAEPVLAQYVKVVGKSTSGSYMSAAMINLFEDTSKKKLPVVKIEYSTTQATTEAVTARLVSDEKILIENNSGSDTYTFTQNGSFEFVYKDTAGSVGRITASVSWITKKEEKATGNDITSTKYEVKADLISNIEPGTNVEEFKKNVKADAGITIMDSNGRVLSDKDVINTNAVALVGKDRKYTLSVHISDVSATFTLQSGGSNETAANAEAGLKQKTVSGTVTQTESMDRDGAVYGGGAEAADTDENGLSQAQPQAEVANSAENSSEKSDVKFNFIIILVIIVMVIAIVELVILLVIFMKKKRR
ncbi:MAG: discoidin domain-containing protein [Lachnospiraceae bacterium]|nr:discoidin domain-containing protein [Lachnospiraceae bacterium]